MRFSYGNHTEHSFDAFCKKVLKNEAINIQKRMKKEREKFCSLSYMLHDGITNLIHYDDYNIYYEKLSILKYEVHIKHNFLAKSMKKISKKRQAIVLLSYFLGMNDREIAEIFDMLQGNVNYHRKQALKDLREGIEKFT